IRVMVNQNSHLSGKIAVVIPLNHAFVIYSIICNRFASLVPYKDKIFVIGGEKNGGGQGRVFCLERRSLARIAAPQSDEEVESPKVADEQEENEDKEDEQEGKEKKELKEKNDADS